MSRLFSSNEQGLGMFCLCFSTFPPRLQFDECQYVVCLSCKLLFSWVETILVVVLTVASHQLQFMPGVLIISVQTSFCSTAPDLEIKDRLILDRTNSQSIGWDEG